MKHGLVSMSDCDFFSQYDLSFCDLVDSSGKIAADQAWNALMGERGFAVNHEVDTFHELFLLICSEFAITYNRKYSITLRKGYITRNSGQTPVKHNEISRIFSQSKSIYIDYLISNVLLEYVATFYLWARYPKKNDIAAQCFIYVLYALEGCCRRGKLSSSDNQISLQELIANNLNDQDLVFIGDLYWCMLSFAMCHEIAHIYCEHGYPASISEGLAQEFEADAVGYDIYLKLMIKNMHNSEDIASSVFREYLYTAPMILFLFYHDLYKMGYWMYGEKIPDTHPPLSERIDKLFDISQDDKYEFNTELGNDVLNNFYDISDKFLTELFYKLKNGKLSNIVRKGATTMTDSAFEKACIFDEKVCEKITKQASYWGYDVQKLIGLWNIAAQVCADSPEMHHGLVATVANKTVSIKGLNIIYKQEVLLQSIIETGLTIAIPQNKTETIRTALYLIYKIALESTIEIKSIHAELLRECHIRNAYSIPIKEEDLLDLVPGASPNEITELDKMKCIEIINGYIYLRERVIMPLT